MLSALFDSWATIGRTLVVAVGAYAALVAILRISGKRTLSKLNAFDLVVTVALGSTLASVATSETTSLTTGVVVFALLIGLQYLIATLSVRLPGVQKAVKARPTLLVRDGEVLEAALADQRVTRTELLQALRQSGKVSLRQAAAVVLETDGTLSVLGHSPDEQDGSALADVDGWPRGAA